MLQPRELTEPASSRVSLYLSSSPAAAWEQVVAPWFESARTQSPASPGVTAMVVPYRSHAHFCRAKLLASGVSLLGIRFLTPPQLREMMLRGAEVDIPLREHLRLLLAATAEQFAARIDDAESPDLLIAKSVARDPDNFLRAIDQLNAAGWEMEELQPPGLRDIAKRFEQRVRDCGFSFVHEADRAVAANVSHRFEALLISGFDGAHWPLWPLLRAAVARSSTATVLLNDPRDAARELDETWIGTWEEHFGATETLTAADDTRREDNRGAPHFVVGRDNTEQARAIVALTAKFLAQENCERIGILFPGAGPLARLVANFLESANVAHNDGIAHLAPSIFDNDAFRAWLELQQNPRLKSLLRFLRASGTSLFDKMSILEVEDVLRRAYCDVLLDDIDILRVYCAQDPGDKRNANVARGLATIQLLPASATLGEFLSQTRRTFAQLGWKEHSSEVDRLSRGWSARFDGAVTKNSYLRWLREILGAPSLSRGQFGSHAYSRVHLLPGAEAEGQSWTHLIFAGLNEETSSSIEEEIGFVPEQEVEEFNRRNRVLNRRATKRGRFGEGQYCVAEGKTLLLGPTERRQIRRRQLLNLVESVDGDIGASANLYSEAFPSRTANPNEFFSSLYFDAHGRGVSQQTLQTLETQTRAWLKDWSPVDAQKIDSVSLGRTRYAFDMRRKVASAGEYEFALRNPPDRGVALRVTEWEQALRSPALIWMKVFLGVEGGDENGDAWRVATGQWVHGWLADAANAENFVDISRVGEIRARIVDLAEQFRAQVEDLCAAGNKSLPDWWISGWSNAIYIADCLATKLAGVEADWSHLAVEYSLGSPAAISLDENQTLRVRGRIDLMLARGEQHQSPIGFANLWVVDYKTGRQRGFNLREARKYKSSRDKFRKQLIEGRGVQLALYALAVHQLGAREVRLTLLSPAADLEPQFNLGDALAQKDFWRELHRMQESGVFGMVGLVHSDFGFARAYPLATLSIDPDLLAEKWVLTHPPFTEPAFSS